jgi:hypothetical protein
VLDDTTEMSWIKAIELQPNENLSWDLKDQQFMVFCDFSLDIIALAITVQAEVSPDNQLKGILPHEISFNTNLSESFKWGDTALNDESELLSTVT